MNNGAMDAAVDADGDLYPEDENTADLDATVRARRALLMQYITDTFVKDRDFSVLPSKRGPQQVLGKGGAERIAEWYDWHAAFAADTATWEMFGSPPGMICYTCTLYTEHGGNPGEGRGSASLGERETWTANNVIKMAEKRAFVDAVLRAAGLSGIFTQDLEDEARAARRASNPGADDDGGGEDAEAAAALRQQAKSLQATLGLSDKTFDQRVEQMFKGTAFAHLSLDDLQILVRALRERVAARDSATER